MLDIIYSNLYSTTNNILSSLPNIFLILIIFVILCFIYDNTFRKYFNTNPNEGRTVNILNDIFIKGPDKVFKKLIDKLLEFIDIIIIPYKKNKKSIFDTYDENAKDLYGNPIKNHYKIYISIILTIIYGIIYYYLINKNIFNIKNDKYFDLIQILFMTSFLFIFYFFVYRNKKVDNDGTFNDNYEKKNITDYIVKEKKRILDKNNLKKSILDPLKNLFLGLSSLILAVLIPFIIVLLLFFIYEKSSTGQNLILYSTIISIIITGLSLYAYLNNYVKNFFNGSSFLDIDCHSLSKSNDTLTEKLQLIFCIIKVFIFFIPCFIVILAKDIHNDIKLTPSPIFIILLLEILFLIFLFILPGLIKKLSNTKNSDMLNGKILYLNEYNELDLKNNINNDTENNFELSLFNKDKNTKFNLELTKNISNNELSNIINSYNISFSLYLDEHDTNTSYAYNKDTILFNFNMAPIILYNGKNRQLIIKTRRINDNSYNEYYDNISNKFNDTKDRNWNNDDLETIFMSDVDDIDSTLYNKYNIKYHTWINFSINYNSLLHDENKIDIFINNKLIYTYSSPTNNYGILKNNKIVTVGENNGIHGNIKDIYYNPITLKQDNLENLYNIINNVSNLNFKKPLN